MRTETLALLLLAVALAGAIAVWLVKRSALRSSRISSLPGTDYRPSAPLRWIELATALAAAVLIAVMLASGARIAAVAVAAVYAAVEATLITLFATAAYATAPLRLARALERPEADAARLAFYFSSHDLKEPLHVTMWLGPLRATGLPFVLLARESKHFEQLIKIADVPVFRMRESLVPIFATFAPRFPGLLYANNSMFNLNLMSSMPESTHVQLLHGDSDKPPSYNPAAKNYDQVFVSGQMAIDRYWNHGVDVPAERFRIVGRPQVAEITPATSREGRPLEVVYMPTWRGYHADSAFSSLDRAEQVIAEVHAALPGARLSFKPHPLSYKDPDWPAMARRIRAALGPDDRFEQSSGPFELYNRADILITDISSVMIDFLYSGKPLLVVRPRGYDAARAWRYPSLEAAYQVEANLNNLTDSLIMAAQDDPHRARREAVRLEAFGDYGRPPGDAFREACEALVAPPGTDGARADEEVARGKH